MQRLFNHKKLVAAAFACALIMGCASTGKAASVQVLHRTVDLRLGEVQNVHLADGKTVQVKLLDLRETRDEVNGAVRRAEVRVELNGQITNLTSGNYHLPVTLGTAQIDCPVTKGYLEKSGGQNPWGLLWQAYEQEHPRQLVAVARPHALLWAGQKATLEGSLSRGQDLHLEWTFTDGGRAAGAQVERTYD